MQLRDRALINLERNALEALSDRPAGVISLTAQRTEERETIFVPFFTTQRPGSGIGPTRARQIAATHGARVDVQHTPGDGATVRLLF